MKIDYVSASEFCESVRDGTHDTPKQVDYGFKLVTSKCIRDGIIDVNEAYYISESDYNKICERSKVEQWDVLMGMIGNGLGRTAVVKRDADYAIKNIALFKIGNEIKAKWLHYYLSSPMGQGEIFNALQGSGQPFISLRILRNFPVPKADDTKMAKVVSGLSAYDNLIENNQKQIKLLEEVAQRLYKEWFVDLRFPGHENVKIVDGVPEGWSKSVVGELALFRRGTTITKSQITKGAVPVIAGGIDPAYFHNKANTVAPVVTVSASGANAGYTMYHNRNVFASDCSFIDASVTDKTCYIYCFLKHYNQTIRNLQKGSAQPHVYAKDLNELSIFIPDKLLLDKFVEYVNCIFDKIERLINCVERLQEARDRLLPKLMSGEIEV